MIISFRRERFTHAFAELILERGYRRVTVGDVVAAARSSRSGFYECFANKEDAFLALLTEGFDDLRVVVETACTAAGDGSGVRMQAGLGAALEWVSDNPARAHACLTEAPAAGPRCLERQYAFRDCLAALLVAAAPARPSRPPMTAELVVGGLISLVAGRLLSAGPQSVLELEPELLQYMLEPYS